MWKMNKEDICSPVLMLLEAFNYYNNSFIVAGFWPVRGERRARKSLLSIWSII
jgi:hypothetical protein